MDSEKGGSNDTLRCSSPNTTYNIPIDGVPLERFLKNQKMWLDAQLTWAYRSNDRQTAHL